MNSALSHSHSGLAYLLLLSTLISLLLAVLLRITASTKCLSIAKITRVIETALTGLIALSGIAALLVGPWSLASIWPWLALVLVFVQSKIAVSKVKPLQLGFSEANASAANSLMAYAAIQCLLVVGIIGLMHVKPF